MAIMGRLEVRAISPRIKGPRGADRGLVMGRSGSGKSVLSTKMLEGYGTGDGVPAAYRGNVIIIDPNGTFKFAANRIVTQPEQVVPSKRHPVLLYRPSVDRLEAEDWNLVFKNLFLSPLPLIVYIDELFALETIFGIRRIPGGNYLTAYLTRGRARGKAFLASVQSPVAFPLNTLRQAEYFYIFDLPLEDDRRRVAGVIGDVSDDGKRIVDRSALGKHEFWFLGPDMHKPVRSIVKL